MLDDDHAGKPEGIYLMIVQRPHAAFGNSTGDQQMLEYTKAGDGARLAMLVLHDDAKKQGWTVISTKDDWKHIFSWEQ